MRRALARLRQVDNATPLRVKLVLVVVTLATAGLALAAVATTASLHSYLIGRVDRQLDQVSDSRFGDARFPNDGNGFPGGSFTGDHRSGAQPGSTSSASSGSRPSLPSEFYIAQINPNGTIYGTPRQASISTQSPPNLPKLTLSTAERLSHNAFTVKSVDGKSSWRVVTHVAPDDSGSIAVATPLSDTTHTIHHVILLETAIGLIALGFIGLLGYLLVARSLRPLVAVEGTAAAIAGGDLSRRVPQLPIRTEVGRLAGALNGMLAQIENAFAHERKSLQQATESEQRMRRFVADASHELRTPLTSIRGFAELFRMGAVADQAELERLMRRIEDEASRMGVLVEDLLLLARLDQQRPLASVDVDLVPIVSDAVHDAQVVAPGRDIDLTVETAQPATVTGDESRLRQVVTNLMSNALSHTPDGTPVSVALSTDDHTATISVSDRGNGIDDAAANRVFERFFRVDDSRTRANGGTTSGSGLGLSIVASLVAAHSGSVDLTPRAGGGAVFTVRLPLHLDAASSHTRPATSEPAKV